MAFSLTGIIKFLDTCEEGRVMQEVVKLYEVESDTRKIFSSSFIASEDLVQLGYKGLKTMLIALYQTNPDFIEQNRNELYSLTRALKGE